MKLIRQPCKPRKCQCCSNIHNWRKTDDRLLLCLGCGALYDISDELSGEAEGRHD